MLSCRVLHGLAFSFSLLGSALQLLVGAPAEEFNLR